MICQLLYLILNSFLEYRNLINHCPVEIAFYRYES